VMLAAELIFRNENCEWSCDCFAESLRDSDSAFEHVSRNTVHLDWINR